jgi:hypothetical protein
MGYVQPDDGKLVANNVSNLGGALSGLRLACLFPNHFVCDFVFPDSKKNGLTETIIPRPLSEFYLANHCRCDPMAKLHFGSSQPALKKTAISGRGKRFRSVRKKPAVREADAYLRRSSSTSRPSLGQPHCDQQ